MMEEFLQVNTIRFDYVFSNFDKLIASNPTVLIVIIGVFVLFLAAFIYARRQDKKDLQRWGVFPLIDNFECDTYMYQIIVETGLRSGSGTKSKVGFVLAGSKGDTGARRLYNRELHGFERGSTQYMIMKCQKSLGDLLSLRVWHDNGGEGGAAGWYLDKIVVEDLQNGRRWMFLCDQWLSLDEDDSVIDRILPVLSPEEQKTFNFVFSENAKKNMADNHVWLSVLWRPQKSHFSRVQRVVCCLCLLFTSMIANAMWYKSSDTVERDYAIHLGPIVLSLSTIYTSLLSAALVVPVNIFLLVLFDKRAPKIFDEISSSRIR